MPCVRRGHIGGKYSAPRMPSAQFLVDDMYWRKVCTHANLVSMTKYNSNKTPSKRPALPPGHWLLQDAKARFSELVRRVRSEGPQHVTVHGRDEVVVVAAEEFRRLQGDRTGRALVAVLQASPHRDIELLIPASKAMPVRDVQL